MRKLIVNEWLTLDGVAQAPGAPDEDRSGGFEHGGWHMPYMDDVAMKAVLELADPLEWQNSTVLQGDVAEAVRALKQEGGDELHVIGSTELIDSQVTSTGGFLAAYAPSSS